MHGAVAPVVQVAASELEAKLGLAEFLLASTDLQASARRAVDWLVSQTQPSSTPSSRSPNPPASQLVIVAEHGVSSAAIVDFVLTRDDEAHPLIKAMYRREPTYFDGPQIVPVAARRALPRGAAVARTNRTGRSGCC